MRRARDSWDESAHPRAPKGGAGGGQFVGGETAGGIDQGEEDSSWHPEKSHDYAGRRPDEAKFGRESDNHNFSDEDEAFIDEHGEEFVPVINELFHEYDTDQGVVENFMNEMGLDDDPEKVLTAFHQSYVGHFDDLDEAAEDFIHETYPKLPKSFTDTISRSDLSDNLFFNKGSPYVSIEDEYGGGYRIFKRPKPLTGDAAVEDEDFDDDCTVIGVNDDGSALVLDAGANVHRTPGGYLAASPRVARVGVQVYRGHEMGVPDRETVRIYRPESEVFNLDSLRSYSNKPVTNDHPKEAVTKSNWRKYAIGHTSEDILRDGGFIRIPMMISDGDAIEEVENGKVELSLGYTMDLDMTPGETPEGEAYDGVMRNIRANHLALVTAARGGKELRVGDSGEGSKQMTKKIVVDSVTVEVDDVGGAIIPKYVERLERGVADAATALKVAQDAASKAVTEVATLTAENATLKKKVEDGKTTPQVLDQMVRDRHVVIALARSVLGDKLVTDGRTDGDIRRQVVDSAMGATAKGWNDDQVASSFAVLTKDAEVEEVETRDGLTRALSNPRPRANTRTALDKAYEERDEALRNAWRKPVAA